MRSRAKQGVLGVLVGAIAFTLNPTLFMGCDTTACGEDHALDDQVSWAASSEEVARTREEVGVTHLLASEDAQVELTLISLDVERSPVASTRWVKSAFACIEASRDTSRAVTGAARITWSDHGGEHTTLDDVPFSGSLDAFGSSPRVLRLFGVGEGFSFELVELEPDLFVLEMYSRSTPELGEVRVTRQ